jgi:hypothetical protein
VAVPVVSYRTVRPCGMLRKELIHDAEEALEAARDSVRRVTAALDDRARDATDAVAEGVQQATVGMVTVAIDLKIDQMSAGECASELIDNKLGRDGR